LSGGGAGPDEAHVRRLGADADALYGLGKDVCAAFFENVGTIPDESQVSVALRGGAAIGKVEESFVAGLREGDVMLLNGKTFRVKEVRASGIDVEPFAGRPNVPAWSSHIKGVPVVLAREIASAARRHRAASARGFGGGGAALARATLQTRGRRGGARGALHRAADGDLGGARRGRSVDRTLSDGPASDGRLSHLRGRRANEALARVVAARLFAHLRVNTTLSTDDNGFLVALPPGAALPDAAWAALLHANEFSRDLLEGLRGGHLLRVHFRTWRPPGCSCCAAPAAARLRRGGLRWNSERIFERLREADPDFPLLAETVRTVTRDLLDAPAAHDFCARLPNEPRVLHPLAASPFSFGIVTSSFGDSVVLDDRASMVEALHERVLAILGEAERAGEAEPAREPASPSPLGPLFERRTG
jgi:ATP-dependent Lhr-like helicase